MSEEIKKLKQEIYKRDIQIRELQKLATKDPLTGLYNRRGFEEEAARIIKDIVYTRENPEARRHFNVDSISILFFDIDNFKKLNDIYGHKVGDQTLQRVAQIIIGKVRTVDFVGRWGGEEMVAALVGTDETEAFKKAEQIRTAIKSRVKAKDDSVTVSIGAASFGDSTTLGEIIKRADKAMYVAKHNRGKDNTVKFSELEK
ncbi:MAG: GGDEF domain-containing protein [Candidatus Colwellbacteria bacterium]|nr:GGDEF domain-containing protein [Candidatus Colwellbacteria bacterium]